MEFTTYQFGQIASFRYGKMPRKGLVKETGEYPIYSGYRYVGYTDEYNTEQNTLIVVARGVGGTGDVKVTKEKCYLTNLSIAIDLNSELASTQYLYYKFLQNNLRYLDSGSAQSQITISDLERVEILLPKKGIQDRIATVLASIDEKIDRNKMINNNLQQQAQALFAENFLNLSDIPQGWRTGNLLDIADYLNGLAMQKFRPKDGENGLPVLKIKELRQGFCDADSELCSPSIRSDYLVHDGDVIFSWSGSLLVDFWCGGDCGLNQHLFKVTSTKYEPWFYYLWTNYHLAKFVAIAADKATTMGHIKREDLAKSEVLIPCDNDYIKIGDILRPLLSTIICNRIENKKLATLRDTLLPKLMSGEIDVSEVEI